MRPAPTSIATKMRGMFDILPRLIRIGMILSPIPCAASPAQAAPELDAPAIDHVGVNVPDVAKAANFFHDLIGTRIISDIRPAPADAAWKRRFGYHLSAQVTRFVMLQTRAGSKIELFQYSSREAARTQPFADDPGATHIAFRANDINRSMKVLRRHHLRILNDPITLADGTRWFYFLSPWGSSIELVFPAARSAH
jgi:catechol 2,3-dioxygenase-like lactoylglutathione lyase family enzyme